MLLTRKLAVAVNAKSLEVMLQSRLLSLYRTSAASISKREAVQDTSDTGKSLKFDQ